MTPLAVTLIGLVAGLAGIALLFSSIAGAAGDAAGGLLAVGGWAAYWTGSFRLIVGRVRNRRRVP